MQQITRVPPVQLRIDGAPQDQVAAALEGVRVSRVLSQPAQCELAFAGEHATDAATALAPGTTLELGIGAPPRTLFTGMVTANEWEQSPERTLVVRVRAYDDLHRLRGTQTLETYTDVTPADLATRLAGRIGLNIDAPRPGPTWRRVIQHTRSDLELLVQVAHRAGLYLDLDGDRLRLFGLEGTGDTRELKLGDSLLEARVTLNSDPAAAGVGATGWDLSKIEPHTADSSEPTLARTEADAASNSAAGRTTLLNLVAPSDDHAAAAAQAELDRRAAASLTLWGLAQGDPTLRPGAKVDLQGSAADASFVLTSVVHTVDSRFGFVTEIASAPPPPPPADDAAVVTIGEVANVDDPDGIGRVTVNLPGFGGVESDWLGVAAAGAGSGKGYVAVPDVGDLVLVVLSHRDPSQGVVLGGLYGGAGPFDAGVDGGRVRRYSFKTPAGHTLVFDDERRSLRLVDQQGSTLEMAADAVLLSAHANLTIEAPGKSIKIRSSSVDFETA